MCNVCVGDSSTKTLLLKLFATKVFKQTCCLPWHVKALVHMICIAVQPMEMMRWERSSQMTFVVMVTGINRCLMRNTVGLIRCKTNCCVLGGVCTFDWPFKTCLRCKAGRYNSALTADRRDSFFWDLCMSFHCKQRKSKHLNSVNALGAFAKARRPTAAGILQSESKRPPHTTLV